jgi:hypothetical protein
MWKLIIKHDQAWSSKHTHMKPPTTSQPLGYRPTIEVSKKKKQQFWSMFSIKHPTSTGRPSKSLMFCRSEGEAAPPSAARCSFLCYTAAVRYRGLQTQQATDREGLGQRKPKESPKNHGKLAEIYRNSTKIQIQLFYLFGYPNPSGHWMALFTKWIRVGWNIQL